MADWKTHISYSYNPSYHAYAYSLMYQPGAEQSHVNLSSWAEPGLSDLSNFPSSASQAYYTPAAAPRSPEQSPPESPEPRAYSSQGHYQGTGLVYLGDPEGSSLLLSGQSQETESRRAGSDSASDSEPHTSPDSWSSGSNGEGSLPRADPATWAHKTDLDDETSSRSPDDEDLPIKEEQQTYCIIGESTNNNNTAASLNAPSIVPKNRSTSKVRAAFSESQMNALVQRFSVQRYLTPAEMKNLAELTGLTYKQVKTWFQNRRMKLRRHQKDNSWATEHYGVNKDNAKQGAIFTNLSSHIQPYQGGEARPVLKGHYSHQMMEAALKKTAPPNLAFYLASMGGAAGSAAYPTWSSGTPQTTVSNRPQAPSWPLPSDVNHFDYNAFNPPSHATVADSGFKDREQINSRAPHSTVIVQNTGQ